MKRRILIAIYIVCAFALSASSIRIGDYSFEVIGKTNAYAVERLVMSEDLEVFSNEDELVEALEAKKQVIINQRVYTKVSYLYTLTPDARGNSIADVTFYLTESHTLFVLPYPKYDTNIGTRLGLKVFESDFWGTLSSVALTVNATFPDTHWDQPQFATSLTVSNFVFRNGMSFDFHGELEADVINGLGGYKGAARMRNIPIGDKLRLALSAGADSSDEGTNYFSFGAELSGIVVRGGEIVPAFSGGIYQEPSDLRYSFLKPELNTTDFDLGPVTLSFSDYVELRRTSNDEPFKAYEVSLTERFGFTSEVLSCYSYRNTLKVKLEDKYVEDENVLTIRLSDITQVHWAENIATRAGSALPEYLDSGIGVTQTIILGDILTFEPTMMEYLRFKFPTTWSDDGLFSRYYSITARGYSDKVDWVGNFRKGYKYDFTINSNWWQYYSSRETKGTGAVDHLELSYYGIWGRYLNPSARVIVNYANGDSTSLDYRYLKYDSVSVTGEYLRGIRNTEITDRNMFASVVNLNLTTYFPLPKFLGFMSAYVNFFFDFACVKESETIDAKNYYGAGIEGIGILNSYPSYPVRLSVGLDLRKLVNYINGVGAFDFYEVYLGLDFFF